MKRVGRVNVYCLKCLGKEGVRYDGLSFSLNLLPPMASCIITFRGSLFASLSTLFVLKPTLFNQHGYSSQFSRVIFVF